jgi:hypothetical protein
MLHFCNALSTKFRKSIGRHAQEAPSFQSPGFIASKLHLPGVLKALASKTANPMQGTLRKGARGN